MDEICLVVPITPGRTAEARSFLLDLDHIRRTDYERSEQRLGISKEVWYIARSSFGDQLVAYMESPNFAKAINLFAESQDEFDVWFKRQLSYATGLDLNHPPADGLPEKLSTYRAVS